nr:hypothetical protein [Planctomycetota bacterium]
VYGDVNPAFTVTYTSFVLGQNQSALGGTLAFGTSAVAGSNVGTYAVTPSGLTSTNYAISFVASNLTVTAAPLVIQTVPVSKVYGDVNPAFTVTYTSFVLGQNQSALGGTLAFGTSAVTSSNVGTYAVTPSGLTSTNYAISFVASNLTITAAPLVIQTVPVSKVYGDVNPAFTVTYTSFVLGQNQSALGGTLAFGTSAVAGSNVGAYAVTPSGLTSTNYAISFVASNLTVTAAPLVVQTVPVSKVYGDVNPAFTVTYTSFVLGQNQSALGGTLAFGTSAVTGSNVGTYAVTPSGLTSANYAIIFTNGSLAITPAALSVTAADGSRAYGAGNPAFTGTLTGVIAGDNITATYASSANATTAAATYGPATAQAIKPTLVDPGSKLGNYTVTSTNGTLTITAATATVAISNTAQTYNGTARPVTVTTGPVGISVATTYDGSGIVPINVGSYTVTSSITDPNYTGSATVTLVVSPAAATVTLSNVTATYDGASHSATVVTNPPGLAVTTTYAGSTTAPTTAGGYALVSTITDPNYSGSASGTFTITKAASTVSLVNMAQTYTGTARIVTATTSGGSYTVDITYNGGVSAPINAGTYAVIGTINDANYAGSASGSLVVSQAGATVTVGGLSHTYNGSAQSATATTSPTGLPVSFTYDGLATVPSLAGSYAVMATVTDPNYSGSGSGTMVIDKASATVTLGSLAQGYTGSPRAATATTLPGGMTVDFIYNGSSTAPTNAGSYTVIGTINDANYAGSASGTLAISKAAATVTLSNLTVTYDTSAHAATVGTAPGGLSVATTYAGSATAPTAAGSYAVVSTVTDPNYSGTANGTLTINKATATVTLASLAQTYTGGARVATASTAPTGLTVTFTYDGSATAPVNAGSYAVVGTVVDANYIGSDSGSLVVSPATATVTLAGLTNTYDGAQHAATATTSPTGLPVSFTYNGSATAPSAVGSYAVVGTVTDPNYSGSANGTLTIASASSTVALSNLSATYDGSAHGATVTSTPAGLSVDVTYNGAAALPVNAGSYTVVANVTQPGYSGTASGTFTINPASATVTLSNLSATYDGAAHAATVATSPGSLAVSVTYAGVATVPSAAGTYAVVATITDPNYVGSGSGSLVIGKATGTVTLANLAQTYTGAARNATATTTPSGMTVTFTYDGSAIAPVNAASYTVVGTIADTNYLGSATASLVVSPASATVAVTGLTHTYDGATHAATITTTPGGLPVTTTYGGLAAVPSAAGSYAVVSTVTDANYSGSGSGTLVITQASASVTLGGLAQVYTGSPIAATSATTPAGLTVDLTYDGSATAPTNAGSYTVVGTINDANYTGTLTDTLVISPASATVALGSLAATYDTTAHAATATTTPAGLSVAFTYAGSGTAPTNAGTYAVVGTVTDPNYTGSASGSLVIAKAAATVSLSGLAQTYDGTARVASGTTSPASLTVAFTYDGSATAPTAAGTYAVVGSVVDANYAGSASGSLVVSPAAATVTITGLAYTYDGSPHAATIATNPSGLSVATTYAGSATVPSNAGSYAVASTITDPNYVGSGSATLVIAKATAPVSLGGLAQSYTGAARIVTASTTPSGLTVAVTYDGSATAPTAAGTYAIVGTVNDANYVGSASGSLLVSAASASVTLGSLAQTYTGSPLSATAVTSPVGLGVDFTYNGSAIAPTNAGTYAVVGTVNDANYSGSASGSLVISPASATVTLGGLNATFDGSAHAASATTSPTGLTVGFTYAGSATAPTNAGTYAVVGTVTDPNYSGSASGSLVISQAAATVALTGLAATYDGSAHGATVTTTPTSLSVTTTYDGLAAAPTNAGSYAVVSNITDPDYSGSASGTLVISPASSTITLGGLNQTYDGTPKVVTATTSPVAGLPVTVTYDGSTTAPTALGTYAVAATVTDPNYSGTATGSLVISAANATITLSNLSYTYDASPHGATVTTSPSGLTYDITYNTVATVPTNAGSYALLVTITQSGYNGSTTGTLVIDPQAASVALSNMTATYDGFSHSATVATVPGGLPVSVTYGGSGTAPTAAGTYAVVATVSDSNYSGSANGSFVISKGTASVTLGSLAQTYSGTPRVATATTVPTGLAVDLTYNGSASAPTNVGTYAVTGTVNDANYDGAGSGSLVVSPASVTVALSNLSLTYNGFAQSATITTTPSGVSVTTTYGGSATVPTAAGSYAVVSTVSDPNYTGSGSGTLVIAKAGATVTLSNLSAAYDGSAHAATATTSPSGLGVALTYAGSPTAPTNAGTYAVVATVTDPNYSGSASGSLVISNSSATVTLSGMAAVYNGATHGATVTTNPGGLSVTTTYNGGAALPVNAGSYAVVSTISDPNYSGSASGTLVISKAVATVTLGSLAQTYNGTPRVATATTAPAGLTVTFTYAGSPTAPTNAGTYAVVGTVSDVNYSGSASGSLVVSKATATVTQSNLAQTYNGATHPITVVTAPAGLTVSTTYAGSGIAPTNAGSYAVVSTVSSANYVGSASGTLVVAKAAQTITFPSVGAHSYLGPDFAISATSSVGLTVTFSVFSGPATMVGASTVHLTGGGSVVLRASQSGNANYAAALDVDQTMVASGAAQTITFTPVGSKAYLDPDFDLVATSTSGLPVSFARISGPATMVGASTVHLTGAGPVVLRAIQAGNANYGAAADVDQTVSVGQGGQTITFATVGPKTYSSPDFTLFASSDAGLPITFSVVSGNATMVGPDTVHLTGAGDVVLRAYNGGNADYLPDVIDQTVTVWPASQTISFTFVPTQTYLNPDFALTATSTSGLTVSFSVAGPGTLMPGNMVHTTGAGTLTLTASQAGDANYGPASVVRTVIVNKASQTITFPAIADYTIGDPAITLAATSNRGLPISYALVSGPATLSGTTLTVTGTGSITVQASQAGTSDILAAANVSRSFTSYNPPSVDAGTVVEDVATGEVYPIVGSYNDPSGHPATFIWSVQSGPGAVVFGDATALSTTAKFMLAGSYVIRLTGDNGLRVVSGTSAVVVKDPDVNTALVGHWKFDEVEGSRAMDASGNDHVGTLSNTGAIRTVGGKSGGALSFDGTGTVTIPHAADLNMQRITLALWMKTATDFIGMANPYPEPIYKADYFSGKGYAMMVTLSDTDLFGLRLHPGTSYTQRQEAAFNDAMLAGAWIHYAGTYDGSQMVLYRNGKVVSTKNVTVTITDANAIPLVLGYGFEGLMDDVRIYNRALTRVDVFGLSGNQADRPIATVDAGPDQMLTYAGFPIALSGSAVDTGATGFTLLPRWKQVSGPAGATFGGTGANSFAPTANLPSAGTYRFQLEVDDGVQVARDEMVVYALAVPADISTNLVALYHADEGSGTAVADSSGNALNGTISGSAFWTPTARYGAGLTMDTTTNFMFVPTAPALDMTQMTLSIWMKPQMRIVDMVHSYPMFFYHADFSANQGWALMTTQVDTNQFGFRLHNGTTYKEVNADETSFGSWIHFVGTYDGSVMRLYRNGDLINSNPVGAMTVPAAVVPLYIGQGFQGDLDEMRIYNRALNATEVKALFIKDPYSAGG